ncbi:MAG: MotA/TolQ/ExbB proton channel family protein [Deltaproteobacteria bacterium]|nr:MotA/TolQ/ExbB proton channel family protein [Deltaproteobacteria bacterium]
MGNNLADLFLKGGWVMWPLLVFSVLTWAVILERAFVYLTLRPKLNRLAQTVARTLGGGDHQAARQVCNGERPFLAELFLGALDTKHSRELAERITERNRMRLVSYLKRNLWILGTIGSASPFLGLLGTVIGIVRAFHDMAEKGAGGFSVVAAGISEALIATAAGLMVAILSLIMYNIFVTAANQTVASLKLTLEELLDSSFGASKTAAQG